MTFPLYVRSPIKEITIDEYSTLIALYELACHLTHLDERYLSQFCDAVDSIAKDLFVHFLGNGNIHSGWITMKTSLLFSFRFQWRIIQWISA